MSKLTDAMTALGKIIAANSSAETAAHLATIDAHLASIDTKEGADEATIADQGAGLQALLASASGTSSAAGTSATVGTAPATTAQAS